MPRSRRRPSYQPSYPENPNSLRTFAGKLGLVILALAALVFLYQIRDALAIFAIAGFFVLLFSPMLTAMERRGIPNVLAVLSAFILVFGLFAVVLATVVPLFADQVAEASRSIAEAARQAARTLQTEGVAGLGLPEVFVTLLPDVRIETLLTWLEQNIANIANFFRENLSNIGSGGLAIVSGVGGALASFALTMLAAFFMALERRTLRNALYATLPGWLSQYLAHREEAIFRIMREWIAWQTKLALMIFTLIFAGLWGLSLFGIDIPSKFSLALIAWLMVYIPYIGTIIALAPAIILASGVGWEALVAVAILYLVVQQIEGLTTPLVMGTNLEISKTLILFAMTVGGTVAGFLGILIALPIAAISQIFIRDLVISLKSPFSSSHGNHLGN